MTKRIFRILAAVLAFSAVCAAPTRSQDSAENLQNRPIDRAGPTGSDYGGVGLIQTRTARFHDWGTIDVGTVFVEPYRRYFINFQFLPFLEGTFRYTDIRNRLYSNDFFFSGSQTFKDRGADLKFKLRDEDRYFPAIAVGLQDGLGTGLFSAEYLVLSKRYLDFDFHLGMGWGLLGSGGMTENPLTFFSDTFRSRTANVGLGGNANFGTFFSGETVGLFGGVEWQTPVRGLVVKLEYDGNGYQNEPLGNRFDVDSPFNLGVSYKPFKWLNMSAGLERGNTAMFRASLTANVNEAGAPKLFDPPPPALKPRPRQADNTEVVRSEFGDFDPRVKRRIRVTQPGDPVAVRADPRPRHMTADVDTLFDGLERSGVEVSGLQIDQGEAVLQTRGNRLRGHPERVDAAAELVTSLLPMPFERVTFQELDDTGRYLDSHTVERGALERSAIVDLMFDELEKLGFELEAVDISHDQADLYVAETSIRDSQDEVYAAGAVLRSLPVPVERVAIVRTRDGREVARNELGRAHVREVARIDMMFEGLEEQGFEVESLDIASGEITVYVNGGENVTEAGYRNAANIVAVSASEESRKVHIVGLRAGIESHRVTLSHAEVMGEATSGEPGAASGASGEAGFEADYTLEEKEAIAEKIFQGLEKEQFVVEAVHLTRRKATVFASPTRFREFARNVGRASRVVAAHAPPEIEIIEVVTMSAGLEISRVSILRTDLENAIRNVGSVDEIWAHAEIKPPEAGLPPFGAFPDDAITNARRYPSLNISVRPGLRQHVGGPDGFYLYQIFLGASASAELYRGWTVQAGATRNVVSTLDQIRLLSDSVLPHVRSDIKEYLQQGEQFALTRLQTDYVFQPLPGLFARVSAGLFEEMFGGVGGELLWRPYGSRLAIGVDWNRVRQRDYDQLFSFRNYRVNTGHVNIFYEMPYYNLLAEVHAGQFLAGDRGAQFALSQKFDSGVRVGAWATFTNVPFEVFGEGSFDKGFFVSLPFDLFLVSSSRRGGTFAFRPLTRDGGQMLVTSKRLYGFVESGNLNQVADDWDRFLD